MTCYDRRLPPQYQAYEINEYNGQSFQVADPFNRGISLRDPTGQYYMRLPAIDPFSEAYFVAWDGQLILLSINHSSPLVIGYCQFISRMPPPPKVQVPTMQLSEYQVIGVPHGTPSIPQRFLPHKIGYFKPAYASEQMITQCLRSSKEDESKFIDCAIKTMFTKQQVSVYKCLSKYEDDTKLAYCLAEKLLGDKERRVLEQVQRCYKEYDSDWQKLPLCMAHDQLDPKAQKSISCLQQQAQSGEVTAWGAVMCIGTSNLNMNPEMTIAVQCATTTGGNPIAWAGCTGGQLTKRELTKCLNDGIGGRDGCFGSNNTIIKGLNQLGKILDQQFGSNDEIVKEFNEALNNITDESGPNNLLVRSINNAVNDITDGPGENNEIRKVANKIFPGIW